MVLDIILLSLIFLLLIAFALTFVKRFISKINGNSLKVARAVLILFAGTLVFFGCSFKGTVDIYNILESFYASAKLFLVDGTLSFESIRPNMPDALKYTYFTFYYVICFIAVSISAYTVLSFFRSFSYNLKFRFYAKKRNICVFNELNTRSLSAAESLLKEDQPLTENCDPKYDFFSVRPSREDAPLIVFCDVFRQNTEASHELVSKAEGLGAICFNKNVIEVHKQLRRIKAYRTSKKRLLRYYLFGQNEKENVHHAIDIVKEETADTITDKNRYENLGIFVVAFSEANGIMLESLNKIDVNDNKKKSYFVRRLDPALMMSHHILFDEKNCLVNAENRDKDLNVLVVGMGKYGFELVKNLTWFYQRKEGSINIHIVDRKFSLKSYAASLCPDLVNYTSSEDKTQDSQFKLIFHDSCDVFSDRFNVILSDEISSLDAVFITLGDDTLNAEAAIHIRMLLDRIHYKDVCNAESNPDDKNSYIKIADNTIEDTIKIFAVIHNDENNLLGKDDIFSNGMYNISFEGMDSKIYLAKNIYNFEVENKAAEILYEENKALATPEAAINYYNASETDRISSIAATCHKKIIKNPLYFSQSSYSRDEYEKLFIVLENKRWNAFARSRGFVLIDKDISPEQREKLYTQAHSSVKRKFTRGKWHNSIVPLSEKCNEEQRKSLR